MRPLAFTGARPFVSFLDVPLMKYLVADYLPVGSWGIFFVANPSRLIPLSKLR
jgi:hypothetical protein